VLAAAVDRPRTALDFDVSGMTLMGQEERPYGGFLLAFFYHAAVVHYGRLGPAPWVDQRGQGSKRWALVAWPYGASLANFGEEPFHAVRLDPRLMKPHYGPFSAVKQVSPAQVFNAWRRPASESTTGDGAYRSVRSRGS
jgi:hypothetical protein